MDKTLRLLYWNPGGIKGKTTALKILAETQDVHFILLGETKLRPTQDIKIPRFFLYRRDCISPKNVAYRGTAVFVREDVVHEELPQVDAEYLCANGVTAHTNQGKIKIFAAYRPPSTSLNKKEFKKIMDGIDSTILVGDLNAKHTSWGSKIISPAGRALYDAAEKFEFEVVGPDEPTHVPAQQNYTPDVLDIVAYQNIKGTINVEVLYDLDEQHLPILVTVGLCITPLTRNPPERVDWIAYQEKLQNLSIGPLKTNEDVESAAISITKSMQDAKLASTSFTQRPPKRRYELPLRIQTMISKKRLLRKQWAETRCPTIKTMLNKETEKVAHAVQLWRGSDWDYRIDEANDSWTSLHKLCRSFTNIPQPAYPLLDKTGQKQYGAKERAELLADHLEEQFVPHPLRQDVSQANIEHQREVTTQVNLLRQLSGPALNGNDFVSPAELAYSVKRLPRRKAAGHDGLPIAAIYQLPRRALVAVAKLFNGILRTGHFPSIWKKAKVIMIPKPGKDKRQPSSYRPISLLPHMAKLFERLLLRRLIPYTTPRQEQFGFRSHHSTTLQLTRVLHTLTNGLNNRKHSIAVFLDVEKAFDRVWHEGLLFKLAQENLPHPLWIVIQSFLYQRTFYVSVEGKDSSIKAISAGVPQGSCLSPALYALYTDDIPTLKEHLNPGEEDVELALFADDSAYIYSSANADFAAAKMQTLLDLLPEWLDKWRMAINVGKTAALLVSRKRSFPKELTLRGQEIQWCNSIKYLGVHIDKRLTMNAHAQHAIKQTRTARAMLGPILHSKLCLKTKVGLYKTYIRSRLTYAAPAWYSLCSHTRRKAIQAQQNITLRVCTDAGRYVRNETLQRDLKVETVQSFVIRLAKKMFEAADNGPYSHLHGLAPLHARPPEQTKIKTWLPTPRNLLEALSSASSSEDEG